jgi:hypothetical protein
MNLQQAASVLFGKSVKLYSWSLVLIVLLYLLTLASFLFHNAVGDATLLVLILCLQITQVFVKYRAVTWYGRGEQARRLDQLEEGLGSIPNALSVQRIRSFTGQCERDKGPGYWFSPAPKGPRRLVEMVEEAAFYTMTYAEVCRNYFFISAGTGFALCVIFLTVAIRIGLQASGVELWSHVIIASLSVFLASDIVALALQYKDLAAAARDSLATASQMAQSNPVRLEQSLELAMEYNASLAQAPPLPNFMHEERRKQLGEEWEAYVRDQARTMET